MRAAPDNAVVAVHNKQAVAVRYKYTLDQLVLQIREHSYQAGTQEGRLFRLRLKMGFELLEARRRVEAGEAGDISWWDWFAENDPLAGHGRKDAEKLLRIASAQNPELEEKEARERNAQHQRAHRLRKREAETVAAETVPAKAETVAPKAESGWR